MSLLSPSLRSEIISRSLGPVLQKSSYFRNCSEEFLQHLCTKCETQRAGPGDRVTEQGTISDTLYFIMKGTVAMRIKKQTSTKCQDMLEQSKSYRITANVKKQRDCKATKRAALANRSDEVETGIMQAGQHFGEQSILRDNVVNCCSIDCKTHVNFILLKRDVVVDAMQRYPEQARELHAQWFQEVTNVMELEPCFSGDIINAKCMNPTKLFAAERIVVWQGDITKLGVDAIVNAANSTLLGGAGVDAAIHSAAGPQLREYCQHLKGCRPGAAKATPSFEMAGARLIFHTVGPQGEDPQVLESCYMSCLELAEANGITSIAFPSLGTGNMGYPKAAAAEIAVKTVARWISCGQDEENHEKKTSPKGPKSPTKSAMSSLMSFSERSGHVAYTEALGNIIWDDLSRRRKERRSHDSDAPATMLERVVFAVFSDEDAHIYVDALNSYLFPRHGA
eukprot:gnl/MRDRNA2_/MRDRNA2_175462_c0_seq1.p1 gnl/MRDRNA2_/MRDRNA2_175462_c0~~gnl/MRDRNA2_/MRDRNA2_175462_c0_seq1.p1  ORF type:complete len:518 (-),score=105.10 gnl/MRDRNA2_/MRDRNA2_175462_c0_seq1:292-1644(-)